MPQRALALGNDVGWRFQSWSLAPTAGLPSFRSTVTLRNGCRSTRYAFAAGTADV